MAAPDANSGISARMDEPNAAEALAGFPPWRIYPAMGFELTHRNGVHNVCAIDKRNYPLVFVGIGALGLGLLGLGAWSGVVGGIWYDKILLGTVFLAFAMWGDRRIRSGAPLIISPTRVHYRSLLGHSTTPLATVAGFSNTEPTRSYAGGRQAWTVSIHMHLTDGTIITVLYGITPLESLCPELMSSAAELTEALNALMAVSSPSHRPDPRQ